MPRRGKHYWAKVFRKASALPITFRRKSSSGGGGGVGGGMSGVIGDVGGCGGVTGGAGGGVGGKCGGARLAPLITRHAPRRALLRWLCEVGRLPSSSPRSMGAHALRSRRPRAPMTCDPVRRAAWRVQPSSCPLLPNIVFMRQTRRILNFMALTLRPAKKFVQKKLGGFQSGINSWRISFPSQCKMATLRSVPGLGLPE